MALHLTSLTLAQPACTPGPPVSSLTYSSSKLCENTHTPHITDEPYSMVLRCGERIERETESSPFPTVHPWSCLSCLSERSHTALRWPKGPGSIPVPARGSRRTGWSQTLREKGYECLCGINYTPSAEELRPWGRYLTTQCADEICCCFTSFTCRADEKNGNRSFHACYFKIEKLNSFSECSRKQIKRLLLF